MGIRSCAWLFALLGAAASAQGVRAAPADPSRPVVRHDIQARIDPSASGLTVVDRMVVQPPSDADAPLHFLLNENLIVDGVELDGEPLAHRVRSGWQPRDFWRRPDFAELEAFAIARQHTLQAPPAGWPSPATITVRFHGVVLDSLKAPKVAYSRGFETTSGLILERGAYLEGATFWIPWTSEDLFTFRLQTVLPRGWHSMSQGRRVAPEASGPDSAQVVEVWEADQPAEEVYLVAGPYTVRERDHGAVRLYTYTYAETPEDLCRTYLDAAGEYLDLYEGKYGAYAYAKFALVENWWQTGFGMPSFTLLGDRVIRLPFIVHTSYGHEILHNWWGNGVYVDARGGNWSEGLTTYGADYFYKEQEGPDAARDYRLTQLVAYRDHAASGGRDFALRRFREREDFATQAVGYGKTMMVFHMIRRRLGDEAFEAGLRALYARNLHRRAGWDDVVAAFASVVPSGSLDLTAWFEQWIGRPGALQLSLGGVERTPEGVRVTLVQDEPWYDVRVPVTVSRGGAITHERVALSGSQAVFDVPADAEWVAADADYDLFRKLHREEIPPTLSQTLGADSTLVVVGSRATGALAEALHQLGDRWSANQNMHVVDERTMTPSERRGRALILLGPGSLADQALALAKAFGPLPAAQDERSRREGLSWIYCVRDPHDPELAWMVVLPAGPEVVESLGRKIPHYGRYSTLLFSGEDNVDKGTWKVMSSPLRVDLAGGEP
jgi:aminopeptidase N